MHGPVLVPPVRPPRTVPSAERQLRLRLTLLALGVGLWTLAIAGRLFHLQVAERDDFQRLAARQSERTLTIDTKRNTWEYVPWASKGRTPPPYRSPRRSCSYCLAVTTQVKLLCKNNWLET